LDPTEKHNFVKGVPRLTDLGYIACANRAANDEKVDHSVLVEWDAGEFYEVTKTPWLTAGICVARKPLEQMVAVGAFGDVIVTGSGENSDEVIGTDTEGPKVIGPLRGARAIDGIPYTVGMKRQIYFRDEQTKWNRVEGIPGPENSTVVGFESIDGFGPNELYAVGWQGEIWYGKGNRWNRLNSPTNLILTDVCCADDGKVYACGQQGLLLVGRENEWTVIDNDDFKIDFWSLTFFSGVLYVASMNLLLCLKDGELVPVDTGPEPAISFGHLRHIKEVMWSTGVNDLMAFDGQSWTRIA